MSIANSAFFSKNHVTEHKFNASEILAEQAIHCLELVAQLNSEKMPFQFKGGNSLLLILEEPQRFSIDVDIATDITRDAIETVLNNLIQKYGVFTNWKKRQHKTKPWLPLASYYLFYNSHFTNPAETSIMLDVQLKKSPYSTQFKQVKCGMLYSADITTEVPLPSSIIGDKLLTLGPKTLGIPIGKSKEAQRLKHVFDVSRLLRTNPRISLIRESFNACFHHELQLQDRSILIGEVLQDTLDYCRSLDSFATIPEKNISDIVGENIKGLNLFASHLFQSGYSWQNLRVDLARSALCVAGLFNVNIQDEDFAQCLTEINSKNSNDLLLEVNEILKNWIGM